MIMFINIIYYLTCVPAQCSTSYFTNLQDLFADPSVNYICQLIYRIPHIPLSLPCIKKSTPPYGIILDSTAVLVIFGSNAIDSLRISLLFPLVVCTSIACVTNTLLLTCQYVSRSYCVMTLD